MNMFFSISYSGITFIKGDRVHLSMAVTDLFLLNLQQGLRILLGFCGVVGVER